MARPRGVPRRGSTHARLDESGAECPRRAPLLSCFHTSLPGPQRSRGDRVELCRDEPAGEWVAGVAGGAVLEASGAQGDGEGLVLGERLALARRHGACPGSEKGNVDEGVEEHCGRGKVGRRTT